MEFTHLLKVREYAQENLDMAKDADTINKYLSIVRKIDGIFELRNDVIHFYRAEEMDEMESHI